MINFASALNPPKRESFDMKRDEINGKIDFPLV